MSASALGCVFRCEIYMVAMLHKIIAKTTKYLCIAAETATVYPGIKGLNNLRCLATVIQLGVLKVKLRPQRSHHEGCSVTGNSSSGLTQI